MPGWTAVESGRATVNSMATRSPGPFNRLLDAAVPPDFGGEDADARARARVVVLVSVLGPVVAILVAASHYALGLAGPLTALTMGCGLLFPLGVAALWWTRSLTAATTVVAAATVLGGASTAWAFGGLVGGVPAFVAGVPLLARLLAGRVAGARALAAFVVMVVVYVPLQAFGTVTFLPTGPLHAAFAGVATLSLGGVMLVVGDVVDRARSRALAAARRTNQRLQAEVAAHAETRASVEALHRIAEDQARLAGRAEVAAAVLHDVGNGLTAATVSVALLRRNLENDAIRRLDRVVELLGQPDSWTGDDGRTRLAAYLAEVSRANAAQTASFRDELASLNVAIDHVASVIRLQQQHAKAPERAEPVDVRTLIDEVAAYVSASFRARGYALLVEVAPLPPLLVHRHRVVQILTNLLTNAREALDGAQVSEPVVWIRASRDGERLRIVVEDNGPGISPESRSRLFSYGFTTKKTGHGLGLHASAAMARSMRGSLTCDDVADGARFVLEVEAPESPATARA
jgi:signal transduction histidine kinase